MGSIVRAEQPSTAAIETSPRQENARMSHHLSRALGARGRLMHHCLTESKPKGSLPEAPVLKGRGRRRRWGRAGGLDEGVHYYLEVMSFNVLHV